MRCDPPTPCGLCSTIPRYVTLTPSIHPRVLHSNALLQAPLGAQVTLQLLLDLLHPLVACEA